MFQGSLSIVGKAVFLHFPKGPNNSFKQTNYLSLVLLHLVSSNNINFLRRK